MNTKYPQRRRPVARGLAILAAVAVAIGIPIWQMAAHFCLSAAQFASQGDQTLRAAPWAFAIWGVIYVGMIIYAFAQFAPGADTPRRRILGWFSILPIGGCAAWIVASALDARWASVVITSVSAATLCIGLLLASRRPGTSGEALLVLWPLGLLAGWLSVAAALNVVTVMTAEGLIAPSGVRIAAVAGIAGVTLWGLLIQRLLATPSFSLALGWGLLGVAVAETTIDPVRSVCAGAAALLVLVSPALFSLGTRGRGAP